MTTPEPPMPADPFGTPPPAYPAGFADPNPPKKKRKKWKIISASVVVVLAALIVVGVLFGRKGSSTPHDAVNKFWTALAAHDVKKAQDYVCSKKDLTSDADFKKAINEITGFEIGAETGSGDTRHYPVTLHLTESGQSFDGTIDTTASKSTGQWYVCDLGSFSLNQ